MMELHNLLLVGCQVFMKPNLNFFPFVDEDSAFDALQTLADLSLMLPAEANEDGKKYIRPIFLLLLEVES